MDKLLANQSGATLIASAPPKSFNRGSLASAIKPCAASSYHSTLKVSRRGASRLIAAVCTGTTNPSTDKTSGRQS